MSAPQRRPKATAADIVEIVRTHNLGAREGKSALWAAIGTLGLAQSEEFRAICERYRAEGLSPGVVNRNAALDFAATMEGAEFLESGVLDELRPNGVKSDSPSVSSSATDGELERLEREVRARKGSGGLPEAVSWVAWNLRRPLHKIKAEDVPNAEALNQLMFARNNETEWRRLYDSRRVPAKGFASDTERGFVDNGDAIQDIIDRIFPGKDSAQRPELRVVGSENGG